MASYPIDVPVLHRILGQCMLRITGDLDAVIVAADGASYQPQGILPQTVTPRFGGHPASMGYLHKVPGHQYTESEQAAIDGYVISTTIASETGDLAIDHYFHGGATINRREQLVAIEQRLGRQVVRNV